ncbi:DgyrCDS8287 [Dimorphilus gyrociliatus]|uniref:DgyrCDS8287 n=1 Tax=Dimorphilus gyrociliatus TaxID=2664684 RepID=A0A7I8VTQ3_9ANNE|nr:DgyrCDS8287 [Dimorphilus gyrociliatus]
MAALEAEPPERFYLERREIFEDTDTDFPYEEIPVDDEFKTSVEIDEDLETAVRTIREAEEDCKAKEQRDAERASATLVETAEVTDDFVRNFLVKMKMEKTLDCFQTEWYENLQKGRLNMEDVGLVPDVYLKNQKLDHDLKHYRSQMEKYKEAALQAKETYIKLRKERDYHRMHHKRVVQEKNKLIQDIKKLKHHYASYEPTLKQLKSKYESAMKEKMLTRLERDRAVGQIQGLQSTIRTMETCRTGSSRDQESEGLRPVQRGSAVLMVDEKGRGPTQRSLLKERSSANNDGETTQLRPDINQRSQFPIDTRVNPLLNEVRQSAHTKRAGGLRLSHSFQGHSHAISGVKMHPKKQILATASDDSTWKLFTVPGGELIMTGEGHQDWVSDCDFHPDGTKLVTGSGDTTVKIWDFTKGSCMHTFMEHKHAVWGTTWHSCGDFIATCSMDNTSKIWDINSLECRHTLRGHADSVNSIEFLAYSNTLLTASADKTISLWDARTAICAQTFYGHMHSVNSACFNLKGDTVASCDSYGVVKLWDVRAVAPMLTIDVGPHPSNKVQFDPSSSVLAIACNDSIVRIYEVATGKISELIGHTDAVQCLTFDRAGEFLVTGGSDLNGYGIEDLFPVRLECFGSFALKICTKDTDVDLAAIVPQGLDKLNDDNFFDEFADYLKIHETLLLDDFRVVKKARVPIIKLWIEGIEIDITLVRPSNDVLYKDLGSRKYITGMNETSIKSISGLRDLNCIMKFLEANDINKKMFINFNATIKFWAIKKGVYSTVLGFFSGASLILMVLFVLKENNTVTDLKTYIQLFFSTFAKWNWKIPLTLENPYNDPPDFIKNFSEMIIHTLSSPRKNSINSSKSSSAAIRKVLSESHQTSEIDEGLFEKKNWIDEYNHFITITAIFETKHPDDKTTKHLDDWAGFIRSRILRFSIELENMKYDDKEIFSIVQPILNNDREMFITSDSRVWLLGLEFTCNFQMNHLNLSQPTRAFTCELKQLATEREIYKSGMKVKVGYSNRNKLNSLGIFE